MLARHQHGDVENARRPVLQCAVMNREVHSGNGEPNAVVIVLFLMFIEAQGTHMVSGFSFRVYIASALSALLQGLSPWPVLVIHKTESLLSFAIIFFSHSLAIHYHTDVHESSLIPPRVTTPQSRVTTVTQAPHIHSATVYTWLTIILTFTSRHSFHHESPPSLHHSRATHSLRQRVHLAGVQFLEVLRLEPRRHVPRHGLDTPRQGLTLVHFSAQLEPFLKPKHTLHTT